MTRPRWFAVVLGLLAAVPVVTAGSAGTSLVGPVALGAGLLVGGGLLVVLTRRRRRAS